MTFAKKRLGQNFLADGRVAARIVEALGPRSDETVVEIGPGHGAGHFAELPKGGG